MGPAGDSFGRVFQKSVDFYEKIFFEPLWRRQNEELEERVVIAELWSVRKRGALDWGGKSDGGFRGFQGSRSGIGLAVRRGCKRCVDRIRRRRFLSVAVSVTNVGRWLESGKAWARRWVLACLLTFGAALRRCERKSTPVASDVKAYRAQARYSACPA